MTTTQVADVEALAGLSALRWLELSGTPPANIAALKRLASLQSLEALKGLTALQWLNLSGAPVANVEPLGGLTKLQSLLICREPRSPMSRRSRDSPRCSRSITRKRRFSLAPFSPLPSLRLRADGLPQEEMDRFQKYAAIGACHFRTCS